MLIRLVSVGVVYPPIEPLPAFCDQRPIAIWRWAMLRGWAEAEASAITAWCSGLPMRTDWTPGQIGAPAVPALGAGSVAGLTESSASVASVSVSNQFGYPSRAFMDGAEAFEAMERGPRHALARVDRRVQGDSERARWGR